MSSFKNFLSFALTLTFFLSLQAEEIVELDPYVVDANAGCPETGKWWYTKIDGFEVLSSASIEQGTELLENFHKYRQALKIFRPVEEQEYETSTIIVCGRKDEFEDFVPSDQKHEKGIVSYLLRRQEHACIVLEHASDLLGDLGLSTRIHSVNFFGRKSKGIWEARYRVKPIRQLVRQLVIYQMSETVHQNTPAWLVEGICQLAMDIQIDETSAQYGQLNYRLGGNGEVVGDRQFDRVLVDQELMPLQVFFTVGLEDPEARNPLAHALWAKQSYCFLHMCRFWNNGTYRQSFDRFIERLAREPISEALFIECFDMTYEQMIKRMKNYTEVHIGHCEKYTFDDNKKFTQAEIVFREATESEVARIKAEALRIAGHHKEALNICRDAFNDGDKDRELVALLGCLEYEESQLERAINFLEFATTHGTLRASAWTTLAKIRLGQYSDSGEVSGEPQKELVFQALAMILKARSLKPLVPDIYGVLAEILKYNIVPISKEFIELMHEGALYFPENTEIILFAANLYESIGDFHNATTLANQGLQFANSDDSRERLENFLQELKMPPAWREEIDIIKINQN